VTTKPPPEQTTLDLGDTTPGPAAGIEAAARELFARLDDLDTDTRIDTINALRLALHEHSPHRGEPVDCVLWVRAGDIQANDYNPNVVAPPEMRLLQRSIIADGYTQPIVAWPVDSDTGTPGYEVVDGFHRNRVGREVRAVARRIHGRLPVAVINPDRTGRDDRMAATVRHNRARGVHIVDNMSDMVIELSRRGKTDTWIADELGMDPDQVLRLKQVQGLAEMFADEEFSEAFEANSPWDSDGDDDSA
jgi:ParB-like chromosome segregation protein Spo0J